ncbi:MAG: FtsQ-type POTRA domain-containing protein [Gemmatimonadetes bacterium]|nr:FtsQ-type POTRA domain-containing protein [Gemmatimonadota bacterium]
MRRDVRILLATACFGAAIAWGGRIPAAIVDMEMFRVEDISVRGLRYLEEAQVVQLLALAPETSVWSDKAPWRERVASHPLVKDVRVSRRLPDGLLVVVTERTPIALGPTPTLEPMDADGRRLPLDPSEYRLDLPVIHTSRRPPRGARHFPRDVRRLAAEVEHLMASDTSFLQLVSSVAWSGQGAVAVRWAEPEVEFLLPVQASPARLREGLGALADAASRTREGMPDVIDLRFADQVVVRRISTGDVN